MPATVAPICIVQLYRSDNPCLCDGDITGSCNCFKSRWCFIKSIVIIVLTAYGILGVLSGL